jgi:thiol-disulfide isomerase/thioredoxin
MTKGRRVLVAIVGLVALQALAIVAYHAVEGARQRRHAAAFRYEPVGPDPRLPRVRFVREDGSTLSSEALHGAPLLLHFWASWCAPCKAELPELLRFAREEKLRLIALSLDDDWPAVRAFFRGTVPPEVVREPARVLKARYEVNVLPDTYLITADGAAAMRFLGARAWSSDGARDALTAHLLPVR